MNMTTAIASPAAPPANFLSRYCNQTIYMLLLALPLALIGFILSVTLLALGIVLTPLLIGLPILKLAIATANGLMRFDLGLQHNAAPAKMNFRYMEAASRQAPVTYKSLFVSLQPYTPIGYWVAKLPIAVLQFAVAAVFPVTCFVTMLSPVIYTVLKQFDIVLFENDLFMNALAPAWTPFERSWIAGGLGLAMLVLGIAVLNGCARLCFGWADRIATSQAEPTATATDPLAVAEPSAPDAGQRDDMPGVTLPAAAAVASETMPYVAKAPEAGSVPVPGLAHASAAGAALGFEHAPATEPASAPASRTASNAAPAYAPATAAAFSSAAGPMADASHPDAEAAMADTPALDEDFRKSPEFEASIEEMLQQLRARQRQEEDNMPQTLPDAALSR